MKIRTFVRQAIEEHLEAICARVEELIALRTPKGPRVKVTFDVPDERARTQAREALARLRGVK